MSDRSRLASPMPRIAGDTELERLVTRSRSIGADPTLVVHGGGNTSSKIEEVDHLGRQRMVLRIKGSGTDLKTIGPDGFPGLFLDELVPLRDRAEMSDAEMVDYLAHCMVEPGSRRPSIETLLHAFLPARHVDHVHADAICALTNTPGGERHVRDALGSDVAVVPYLRPGFGLARQVAALAGGSAVVLDKHGLVTWGDTHEEAYGRTLELVARAEAYLAEREGAAALAAAPELDTATTESLLLTLRGVLSHEGRRILHVDRTQRIFADRSDVDLVATAARATPDHILRIGPRSLVVRDPENIAAEVAAFAEEYRDYFARHQHRLPPGLGMHSPLPRVMLVPGLGCIATGPDARTARVNAEIAARSHLVTARVLDAFGAVNWLHERDVFHFDYWPLELAKLQSAPPSQAYSGHVAIVTGAGTALGHAVAIRLARAGAHLVLAGGERERLHRTTAPLPAETIRLADGDPIGTAIAAFGGVDVLVALDAMPRGDQDRLGATFERQGGGAIVGLETAPGATFDLSQEFGAGIRINALQVEANADPNMVAEVITFLASSHAAEIDRAIIPVGPRPGSSRQTPIREQL